MNENQVLSKLKLIGDRGNIKDVDFLFNCLQSENAIIVKASFDILVNIKVKSANKIIVEKIKLRENKQILNMLVSICWQSGLDFTDDLLLFFNIVVNEELSVAIEAMSVIENILANNTIDEKVILKGLGIFNNYIDISENNVKTLMIKDFIDTFK